MLWGCLIGSIAVFLIMGAYELRAATAMKTLDRASATWCIPLDKGGGFVYALIPYAIVVALQSSLINGVRLGIITPGQNHK